MDARDKRILELESLLKAALERIAELESEVAALKKNSSNSSKPPSSDIVKPPKNAVKNGKKRKQGAQKGHKRNLRKPFAAEQVDKVVELKLDSCPKCGDKLVPTGETKTHQQVELVTKPFIVTEYHQNEYCCEHCQQLYTPELPKAVRKSGLFGTNLIALTAYLKGRCHISYTTLQDFFADVLSLKVSTGFLAKQVRKVTDAMAPSYDELLKRLPTEPHLHIDETGNKENGQKRWTWSLRSSEATVFHIDKSRGSSVLTKLLGDDYAGLISCDFWGAYRKFARLSSSELQFCWAHLIREVKFLVESVEKNVSRYGKRLLKRIWSMFSTIHRRGELLERTWLRRMQLHREAILKTARGTIPDDKNARNISERLWSWQDEYFRFIASGVAPTNNAAEQAIRRVVIDRKVTQGTRSEWGNDWQSRFWSVLATCEQQGKNVSLFLKASIASLLQGTTPPSLIND